MKSIAVGEFKAKCLALISEMTQSQKRIIITKYGKPVATLTPYADEEAPENPLKGSITFQSDLISPIDENWEASQ